MSMVQSVRQNDRSDRLSLWIQLPRRILLLLIAFGLALLLLRGLYGIWAADVPGLSSSTRSPADLIGEYLSNTLLLLGAALLVVVLSTVVKVLIGVLVHMLEARAGPVGSVLKGLGRIWVFGNAAAPAVGIASVLVYVFAISLGWLPAGGMVSMTRDAGLIDRLAHLILPTLTLSLLPSMLTAQAVTRQVTLARQEGGFRLWLGGLCKGLAVLFAQTGGLLSALVVVEQVFGWPGVGRLAYMALVRLDIALFFSILRTFATLVLIGRFLAELFGWLERLLHIPMLSPQPEPTQWQQRARVIWTIVALLPMLIPLGLGVVGLVFVGSDAALQANPQQRLEPPSGEHLLGTDSLGRDIAARTAGSATITFGLAALVAVLLLIPSSLWGMLAGLLADKKVLWAESVADIILLPLDALLFLPVSLGAGVLVFLLRSVTRARGAAAWIILGLACLVMLLARAARLTQTLWLARSKRRGHSGSALAGIGALLIGALFAATQLLVSVDFLGLGVSPPTPSFGMMLSEMTMALRAQSGSVPIVCIILGICTVTFYTAADALIGFFDSKEPMARFNE
ncbi:MAG: hypothetical protein JW934_24705 [Anaerolineae bacterium]|nr:hypothetical protein [Anaerolineae bacterium]